MKEKMKGLTGAALKTICIVAMFVDHIAGSLILRWNAEGGDMQSLFMNLPAFLGGDMSYEDLYRMFKTIGRIVFPIFCFFLVEGFYYTKSRVKYASRLFAFAFISELPFDWAFFVYPSITEDGLFNLMPQFEHQNVFFTLGIGFGLMCALDEIRKLIYKLTAKKATAWKILRVALCVIAYAIVILSVSLLANAMHTDYSGLGIFAIAIMYLVYLSNGSDSELKKWRRVLAFVLGISLLNVFNNPGITVVTTLLIYLYNGQRGKQSKYFFYAFYPGHILLLAVAGTLLSYYIW